MDWVKLSSLQNEEKSAKLKWCLAISLPHGHKSEAGKSAEAEVNSLRRRGKDGKEMDVGDILFPPPPHPTPKPALSALQAPSEAEQAGWLR